MKNFTVAILSFYEGVLSNSKQPKSVEKSDSELISNNRTKFLKNIPARNFLSGFYGICLGLLKSVETRIVSSFTGLNSKGKYCCYFDLVTGRRVCLDSAQAFTTGRSFIIVLVSLLTIDVQFAQAQFTGGVTYSWTAGPETFTATDANSVVTI